MKRLITACMTLLLAGVMAAQTQPATATVPSDPAATQVAHPERNVPVQTHDNYSWIGLLGLLGLAGLARRREGVRTHVVERTTVNDRDRNERFGRDRDDIRRVG